MHKAIQELPDYILRNCLKQDVLGVLHTYMRIES